MNDDASSEISRVVGECAGAVSLCWEPRPEGVFDSTQAATYVDGAVARLMSVLGAEVARERDHAFWSASMASERAGLLADLRAKVLAVPAHAVRMEYEWVNGVGWQASNKVIDTVPVASILALLDEEMK